MRKLTRLLFTMAFLLSLSGTAFSQLTRLWGYAQQGAAAVTVNGISAVISQGTSNVTLASYPNATVTIYAAGGAILPGRWVFSDSSGTIKGNPFTADANAYWFCYLVAGTYDVRFSGTGITVPFTNGGITVGASGGGGSMVYPDSGIPVSVGVAGPWGASLVPTLNTVLWGDGTVWAATADPTISAANMTNFPTLNQSTSGNADTATYATTAGSAAGAGTVTGLSITPGQTLTVTTTGTLGTAAYKDLSYFDAAGSVTPTSLGLVIGTNVQAYNANLTAIDQALTTASSPNFNTVTAALTGHASLDLPLAGGTMTGGLNVVGADGAMVTRFDGASNQLGIIPYLNSTYGAYLVSRNAADTYKPMSFDASAFYFGTGNVGIGTPGPTHKLEVIGDAYPLYNKTTTSGTYISGFWDNQVNQTYIGTEATTPAGVYTGSLADASFVGAGAAYPLQFFTDAAARMTILSGGNVGFRTLTPRSTADIKGDLTIENSTDSSYVAFTVASGTSSKTYTWPSADGLNTYVLSTDGAGHLFFTAPGGGGGTGILSFNGSVITAQTLVGDGGLISVSNSGTGNYIHTVSFNPSAVFNLGASAGTTGKLTLTGVTSGVVGLTVASTAGTWTFKLPASGGTAAYPLITDGSGNSSWSLLTVPGGGTGLATITTNGILYGNGTSAIGMTAAGTTGQHLTNSSGVPAWTTATFPATATGTGTLLRANGTNWVATTATYPTTTTAYQILYSSGTSVVGEIANNTTVPHNVFLAQTEVVGVASPPAYFDLLGTANTWTAAQTITTLNLTGTSNQIVLQSGQTYTGTLTWPTLTVNRSVKFPDMGGSVVLSPTAGPVSFTGPAAARAFVLPDAAGYIMAPATAGTTGQALISSASSAPTWYAPTATQVLFAGVSGILASSANMTFVSPNLSLGASGTAGGLVLWDSGTHHTTIGVATMTVDSTLTLPASGILLTTTGNGASLTNTSLTATYIPVAGTSGTLANSGLTWGSNKLTNTGDFVTKGPWLDVRAYGAVCDGTSHPLSAFYGTLGAAQVVYPFVTSLTQNIDYAAIQAATNAAEAMTYHGYVLFPAVGCASNSTILITSGVEWGGIGHRDPDGLDAGGSALIWTGSNGGTMVTVATGGNSMIANVTFHDISFEAAGPSTTAGTVLELIATDGVEIRNASIRDFTIYGIHLEGITLEGLNTGLGTRYLRVLNTNIQVNHFGTGLTSGINSSVTTIPVTATTGVLGNAFLYIGSEMIVCTTAGSSSFSGCTRGAGGSTAATHTNGSNVLYEYAYATPISMDDGETNWNVCHTSFENIETGSAGINPAIQVRGDNNAFINVRNYTPGNVANTIDIGGTCSNGANYLYHIQGGISVHDHSWGNLCFGYGEDNSEPEPTIEAGSELTYFAANEAGTFKLVGTGVRGVDQSFMAIRNNSTTFTSNYPCIVSGSPTCGVQGLLIDMGGLTNAPADLLGIRYGNASLFRVISSGGVVVGTPSGGDKGAGTINATSLYINGAPTSYLYSPIAGSSSIVTTGTITTGSWAGTVIPRAYGGTGSTNGSINGTGTMLFQTLSAGDIQLQPYNSGYAVWIEGGSPIAFSGSSGGRAYLAGPTSGGGAQLYLPGVDGTAGQVLSWNAGGIMSWISNTPLEYTQALEARIATLEAQISQLTGVRK